jgi:nifR3 family TIM-barrel protein
LQLFGSDPDIISSIAQEIEERPFDILDINMGCPVPKIVNNGEGSALMKSPDLIYKIVKAVKGAVTIPVTVKLRLGVDRGHINAVECALAAEEAGATLIALHGRTRVEMYSGAADLEMIKTVKDSIHIPLIANGDVTDAESAKRALLLTGADGLMIGRGAIGNPFVFAAVKAALSGEEYSEPTLSERKEVALLQLSYAIEEKGEGVAVREARKQIAQYFRGFRGSAELRAAINRALTLDEVGVAVAAVSE